MELNKEIIEAQGLSEDQVKAVNEVIQSSTDEAGVAKLKEEWDGKATKDADSILDGAAVKITEVTKVEREKGEKIGDYLNRSWDAFSKEGQEALKAAKQAYDDKVTNFEGDKSIKSELEILKTTHNDFKDKVKDFDELVGTKTKYDELVISNDTLKQGMAFGSVKPSFHKDSNQYEVKAKWDEFIKEIMKDNNIVLVESVAMAIDKKDVHKQKKLQDLVDADKGLQALVKGRNQEGVNAHQNGEVLNIEGVPFDVPANADSAVRAKLIRDYLVKKGVEVTDEKYSPEFQELNTKIKQGTAK